MYDPSSTTVPSWTHLVRNERGATTAVVQEENGRRRRVLQPVAVSARMKERLVGVEVKLMTAVVRPPVYPPARDQRDQLMWM